jgi:hypothetical protein
MALPCLAHSIHRGLAFRYTARIFFQRELYPLALLDGLVSLLCSGQRNTRPVINVRQFGALHLLGADRGLMLLGLPCAGDVSVYSALVLVGVDAPCIRGLRAYVLGKTSSLRGRGCACTFGNNDALLSPPKYFLCRKGVSCGSVLGRAAALRGPCSLACY